MQAKTKHTIVRTMFAQVCGIHANTYIILNTNNHTHDIVRFIDYVCPNSLVIRRLNVKNYYKQLVRVVITAVVAVAVTAAADMLYQYYFCFCYLLYANSVCVVMPHGVYHCYGCCCCCNCIRCIAPLMMRICQFICSQSLTLAFNCVIGHEKSWSITEIKLKIVK